MKPTLGRIVHYRGKQGLQALRAAIVTADVASLDPRGVESGEVPALTADTNVHLWVFTPGERGGFAEYNVPQDEPGYCRPGMWQWPTRADALPVMNAWVDPAARTAPAPSYLPSHVQTFTVGG